MPTGTPRNCSSTRDARKILHIQCEPGLHWFIHRQTVSVPRVRSADASLSVSVRPGIFRAGLMAGLEAGELGVGTMPASQGSAVRGPLLSATTMRL